MLAVRKAMIVDAVQWIDTNFKELTDAFDGYVSWRSNEMTWEDSNPPADLEVYVRDVKVNSGDYVVKDNGEVFVFPKDLFEHTFKVIA